MSPAEFRDMHPETQNQNVSHRFRISAEVGCIERRAIGRCGTDPEHPGFGYYARDYAEGTVIRFLRIDPDPSRAPARVAPRRDVRGRGTSSNRRQRTEPPPAPG